MVDVQERDVWVLLPQHHEHLHNNTLGVTMESNRRKVTVTRILKIDESESTWTLPVREGRWTSKVGGEIPINPYLYN